MMNATVHYNDHNDHDDDDDELAAMCAFSLKTTELQQQQQQQRGFYQPPHSTTTTIVPPPPPAFQPCPVTLKPSLPIQKKSSTSMVHQQQQQQTRGSGYTPPLKKARDTNDKFDYTVFTMSDLLQDEKTYGAPKKSVTDKEIPMLCNILFRTEDSGKKWYLPVLCHDATGITNNRNDILGIIFSLMMIFSIPRWSTRKWHVLYSPTGKCAITTSGIPYIQMALLNGVTWKQNAPKDKLSKWLTSKNVEIKNLDLIQPLIVLSNVMSAICTRDGGCLVIDGVIHTSENKYSEEFGELKRLADTEVAGATLSKTCLWFACNSDDIVRNQLLSSSEDEQRRRQYDNVRNSLFQAFDQFDINPRYDWNTELERLVRYFGALSWVVDIEEEQKAQTRLNSFQLVAMAHQCNLLEISSSCSSSTSTSTSNSATNTCNWSTLLTKPPTGIWFQASHNYSIKSIGGHGRPLNDTAVTGSGSGSDDTLCHSDCLVESITQQRVSCAKPAEKMMIDDDDDDDHHETAGVEIQFMGNITMKTNDKMQEERCNCNGIYFNVGAFKLSKRQRAILETLDAQIKALIANAHHHL